MRQFIIGRRIPLRLLAIGLAALLTVTALMAPLMTRVYADGPSYGPDPVPDGQQYRIDGRTLTARHSGYWFQYPFPGGAYTYPLTLFSTEDGTAAYTLVPSALDVETGDLTTGTMTPEMLSGDQSTAIRKVISATGSGASSVRQAAAQVMIWEIATDRQSGTGDIYDIVVAANGGKLLETYEALIEEVQNRKRELPSFLSASKDSPREHPLEPVGGSWEAALVNTGPEIPLRAEDFSTSAALEFTVSGQTLTVTSDRQPAERTLVTWNGDGGSGGLLLWCGAQARGLQDPGRYADPGYLTLITKEAAETSLTIYTRQKGSKSAAVAGATYRVRNTDGSGLYDVESNSKGIVSLDLPAGEYTVELLTAPDGYQVEDEVQEVTVTAGKGAEVTFTIEAHRGAIEIKAVAAAENPLSGDARGAALAKAEFIVYSGAEPVDQITTQSGGYAKTGPLPAGKYTVRQASAPEYYLLSDETYTVEIKENSDTAFLEAAFSPQDIGVTIEVRGNLEVMAGDDMRYDFQAVRNDSNTALEDFYWRFSVPVDAVRLQTVHTGAWNRAATIVVQYRTNLSSNSKVLASDLSAKTNHKLDFTGLKLGEGEYVTEVSVRFGSVPAGFQEETPPAVVVSTRSNLQEGYRIIGKAEAGGKAGGKNVAATDSWDTTARVAGKLPQTGY